MLPLAVYGGIFALEKFTWTDSKKEKTLKQQVSYAFNWSIFSCVCVFFYDIGVQSFGGQTSAANCCYSKQLQQCIDV